MTSVLVIVVVLIAAALMTPRAAAGQIASERLRRATALRRKF